MRTLPLLLLSALSLVLIDCDQSYDFRLRGDHAHMDCGQMPQKIGSTCEEVADSTTSVALDDASCVALATHDTQKLIETTLNERMMLGLTKEQALSQLPWLVKHIPAENEKAYQAASRQNRIVKVQAGLKVKYLNGFAVVNGQLVPSTSMEQGTASVSWVAITEDRFAGQKVCLQRDNLITRYGAMP